MKKLISVLLTVLLIAAALPLSAAPVSAAGKPVVYLSASGSDAANGTDAAHPVATFARAFDRLGGKDGTIVVLDRLSEWPTQSFSGNVSVTGLAPTGIRYTDAGITRPSNQRPLISGNLSLSYIKDYLYCEPGVTTVKNATKFNQIRIGGADCSIGPQYEVYVAGKNNSSDPDTTTDISINVPADPQYTLDKLTGQTVTINTPMLANTGFINYSNRTYTGTMNLNFGPGASGNFYIGGDAGSTNTMTLNAPLYIRVKDTDAVTLWRGGSKNGVKSTISGMQVIFQNSDSDICDFAYAAGAQGFFKNNGGEYIIRTNVDDAGLDSVTPLALNRVHLGVGPGSEVTVKTPDGTKNVYTADTDLSLTEGETTITFENDFPVIGAQIRLPDESGSLCREGLRFIASMPAALYDSVCGQYDAETLAGEGFLPADPKGDASYGYGFLVLPTDKLGGKALTLETPDAAIVPARNTFRRVEKDGVLEELQYTVCLIGIEPLNYKSGVTVRPYIRYEDGKAVYGETYGASAYDVAVCAAADTSGETEKTREWLKENVIEAQEKAMIDFVANGGRDAEHYLTNLCYAESMNDGMVLSAVDTAAELMKEDILSSPNTVTSPTGTVYYIAEDGSGSGSSPDDAMSMESFMSMKLKGGETVLFKRGGVYRTGYQSIPIANGVTYSAYGEGQKPLLLQSRRNFADPSLWEPVEGYPNVYRCTMDLVNVGIIGFDHDMTDYSEDSYNEIYGKICNPGTFGINTYADLSEDLQFLSALDSSTLLKPTPLYLYSTKGNPGERFSSIEIGERINMISGSSSNVTVDNLSFKFTGAHAVGLGGCRNLTVKNCVFSWLGGSVLSYKADGTATNYGNAVQIYGSVNGYTVHDNWMYQIYDTAVTHQYSTGANETDMQNISYRGNLMEYVHWGVEIYDNSTTGGLVDNVDIRYNICRLGGYGWGSIVRNRASGARLYCIAGFGANVTNSNEVTTCNVIDRCAGYLLSAPASSNEFQDRNIYIQHSGLHLGTLRGTNIVCDEAHAAQDIAQYWGDEHARVIVLHE